MQLIARKAFIMFPMKITHSGYLPPSKIGRLSFLQLFRDSISPRRLRRLRGCHFSIHVYIDIYYMHIYILCIYILCMYTYTYIYIYSLYIYMYILYVYIYMYNKYNTHSFSVLQKWYPKIAIQNRQMVILSKNVYPIFRQTHSVCI